MPDIELEIVGMRDFIRACGEARRDMSKVLTQASMKTARRVVDESAGLAANDRLSVKVQRTVKAVNSRYPTIVAGGTRQVAVTRRRGMAKTRPKAGEVFFGAEFGGGKGLNTSTEGPEWNTRTGRKRIMQRRARGGRTNQFRPHLGRKGYWLWPTIRKMHGEIADIYMDSLDEVLSKLAK